MKTDPPSKPIATADQPLLSQPPPHSVSFNNLPFNFSLANQYLSSIKPIIRIQYHSSCLIITGELINFFLFNQF